MFSHIVIGANDIAQAKAFYDATLGALGIPAGHIDERGRVIYQHDGGRFIVTRPIDGEPATHANGGTIGFHAPSTEAADAWHAAGVAHGGTAIQNPPGIRNATEGRVVYLAYLRDPAGNKLCAYLRLN